MTRGDFIEKYGDVWVQYVYRYNYMYTYEGDLSDGSVIIVHCGGQPDSRYDKLGFVDLVKIKRLDNLMSAYVYKSGQLIEGFDEQL